MRRFGLAAALLIGLAVTSPAQTLLEPARTLEADTPLTTVTGASFVAPKGWSLRTEGPAHILGAPEPGSQIAFVDTAGGDADMAVAAAWAAYRPGAAPSAESSEERAPRDGWEQRQHYTYAAADGRTLFAQARRKGANWTVLIFDMDDNVAGMRDSQIEVILNKFWPPGYARESFAGKTAHKIDAARLKKLTDFIELARRLDNIPGVAFGLVQDGEIVFEGGFGVRELGKPDPVDADTKFMIASLNKGLTTLMLAKLVEAGRLDWETPVASIWPDFKLGDAATTAKVLVKHLVCACTGLPRKDFEWLFTGDTAHAASVLEWLSTVQPTSAFGDLFQYSNLLAGAAGYLGGHLTHPDLELGAAYDRVMQDLVFDPLGMTVTTFDLAKGQAGNFAAPHDYDIDGKQTVAAMGINDASYTSRPDGGAFSSVRDMLRFVRMELANGLLPDGTRYIAQAPLLQRRVPQVTEGSDEYYAMGLKLDRIWGVEIVHHGGIASGYRTSMMWLPEHNVGAVLLINAGSGSGLRAAFRRYLLEVLFDGEPVAEAQLVSGAESEKQERVEARAALTIPADPATTAALATHYTNQDLGDLTTRREGAMVIFDTGGWSSEVAMLKEAAVPTFTTISPGIEGFEFVASEEGGVRRLTINDGFRDFVFTELK